MAVPLPCRNEPDSILRRLRTATAAAHLQIEETFNLDRRLASRRAYRDLILRLYGFHFYWEPEVEAALAEPGLFRGRRKVGLLLDDLRMLGPVRRDVLHEVAGPLLELGGRAEALGSMYVMEGSTLGGLVVARQVERRLGFGHGAGCSYFGCYGDRTQARWKEFRAALVALCPTGGEAAVIASAQRTFATLQGWLR